MWLFIGISAGITGLLGLIFMLRGKRKLWLSFVSLALTALTLCAAYNQASRWVMAEDWSALMDVIPYVARRFWFLTAASFAINGFAVFFRKD